MRVGEGSKGSSTRTPHPIGPAFTNVPAGKPPKQRHLARCQYRKTARCQKGPRKDGPRTYKHTTNCSMCLKIPPQPTKHGTSELSIAGRRGRQGIIHPNLPPRWRRIPFARGERASRGERRSKNHLQTPPPTQGTARLRRICSLAPRHPWTVDPSTPPSFPHW